LSRFADSAPTGKIGLFEGRFIQRRVAQLGRVLFYSSYLDNDADFVTPLDMLAELRDDNKQLVANLRERMVCATNTAMLRVRA
jgi:hypothetical protein